MHRSPFACCRAAVAGFALLLVAAAGCSSQRDDLAEVRRERCVLFEGVSKTIPPGGVPIVVDVPRQWTRTDSEDGSCDFRPASGKTGFMSVRLEFCVELPNTQPCDAHLAIEGPRRTREYELLDQHVRTIEIRRADPQSHHVAVCSATIQGTELTEAMARRQAKLVELCEAFAIAR
ncbi:MAG: hypothetical protein ACTHU0_10490 [Kofleriaceae bacterium]